MCDSDHKALSWRGAKNALILVSCQTWVEAFAFKSMVLTTVGPLEACAELLEMNEALRALKAGCNREIIVLKN